MDEKLKKETQNVLKLIQEARKYSTPFHPAKLFEIAESLISYQAWLISPLLQTEALYRQKIIDFKNEEITEKEKIIKRTNAESENMAKTTQEYQDYKFLQMVSDIIEQQILLIKKFADKLDQDTTKY